MGMWKWWDTSKAAWGLLAIGVGGGIVLTYISPQVGIPVGIVITVAGIILVIRAYQSKAKTKQQSQIEDDKKASLLALPDALQALGELDIELVNKLGQERIEISKLQRIISRLQTDWEVEPQKAPNNSSRQEIREVVDQTAKQMQLSYDSVDNTTMKFMEHIGGVLDDEGVGMSVKREESKEYKLVSKLQAKIAREELNGAVRTYLGYSLGINSILLFMSYCPPEVVKALLQMLGKTSTELRAERTDTLQHLLTKVSGLVDKEVHGDKQR